MKRFQTDETLSDYGLHRKDCYSMPRLDSGIATKDRGFINIEFLRLGHSTAMPLQRLALSGYLIHIPKLFGVAERVGRMIDWQWVSGALEKHVANGDRPISISFT